MLIARFWTHDPNSHMIKWNHDVTKCNILVYYTGQVKLFFKRNVIYSGQVKLFFSMECVPLYLIK